MTGQSPWTVLGIDETASPAKVKAAYRRAVYRWHPDGAGAGDVDRFMEARTAYQEILAVLERRPDVPHEYLYVTPRPPAQAPAHPASGKNDPGTQPPSRHVDADIAGIVDAMFPLDDTEPPPTPKLPDPPARPAPPAAPTVHHPAPDDPGHAIPARAGETDTKVRAGHRIDSSTVATAIGFATVTGIVRAVLQSNLSVYWQAPTVVLVAGVAAIAAILVAAATIIDRRVLIPGGAVAAVVVTTAELLVWAVVPICLAVTVFLVKIGRSRALTSRGKHQVSGVESL